MSPGLCCFYILKLGKFVKFCGRQFIRSMKIDMIPRGMVYSQPPNKRQFQPELSVGSHELDQDVQFKNMQ